MSNRTIDNDPELKSTANLNVYNKYDFLSFGEGLQEM